MAKRIALLGHCQAHTLKECLEPLTGADITLYSFASAETAANAEQIAAGLPSFDAVVSHPNPPPALERLRPEILSKTTRVLTIPTIGFTGFHPDFQLGPGVLPKSALGFHHSAIVLGCFLAGIPEHQVLSKFNAYFYGRLGYFDEFAKSQRFLLKSAADLGFDLSSYFPRWIAAGTFMHSSNHPKVRVLADLARLIAQKLELPHNPTMLVEDCIHDRMIDAVVLPVYPEIARRLNVSGSMFVKHHRATKGLEGKIVPMEWLIAESYRTYPDVDWTNCQVAPALALQAILREGPGYSIPRPRPKAQLSSAVRDRLLQHRLLQGDGGLEPHHAVNH